MQSRKVPELLLKAPSIKQFPITLDLCRVLRHGLRVIYFQKMMDSVLNEVNVCDDRGGAVRHLDLMPPVDGAAHVEEEVVSHERVPNLQRALDDFLRADHLPADLVEVIDGPVSVLAEGVEVLFHLLEYLLCVAIAAQAV